MQVIYGDYVSIEACSRLFRCLHETGLTTGELVGEIEIGYGLIDSCTYIALFDHGLEFSISVFDNTNDIAICEFDSDHSIIYDPEHHRSLDIIIADLETKGGKQ